MKSTFQILFMYYFMCNLFQTIFYVLNTSWRAALSMCNKYFHSANIKFIWNVLHIFIIHQFLMHLAFNNFFFFSFKIGFVKLRHHPTHTSNLQHFLSLHFCVGARKKIRFVSNIFFKVIQHTTWARARSLQCTHIILIFTVSTSNLNSTSTAQHSHIFIYMLNRIFCNSNNANNS